MKAYGEKKCLFNTLTLDDLGMTQGQGKSAKFHCLSLFYHLKSS